MVTWIVLAAVLFALVVLAVAVRRAVAGLPGLNRAARGLRRREAQAETLRQSAEGLQEQVDALAAQVEAAQRRVLTLRARRGR